MKAFTRILALAAVMLGLTLGVVPGASAQTLLTEDFTKDVSSNNGSVGNWLFFNGACLTAGTATSLSSPALSIPACTTVLNSYYANSQDHDQYLMGGANGFLGGTSAPSSPSGQVADPIGSGALRFTNGRPYGNQQRGAIVSTNAYSTSSGIQVTFKTVTYGGTGADGISFYLLDGCVPVSGAIMPSSCSPTAIYPSGAANVPAIGATGGSFAYTCSNTNGPGSGAGVTYDGLTGGYLGLGIDEYGNFLNQGDNTASGYGFRAGRIGLRGAGAISWPALNNAYGVNPNNAAKPFYPAWLNATCGTGTFDASVAGCGVCPTIAPTSVTNSATGTVTATTTVSTYVTGGTCSNVTTTNVTISNCNSGDTYNPLAVPQVCGRCNSSGTYVPVGTLAYPKGYCTRAARSDGTCRSGFSMDSTLGICTTSSTSVMTTSTPVNLATAGVTTTVGLPFITAASAPLAYTVNNTAIQAAMQKTCSTGHLWNYAAVVPTDAGPATLPTDPVTANVNNTAKILDYAPIPNAYTNLPSANPLYNGSATTRSAATTIFYNLKITSDGYLSLSYAYNGGAYQSVIANQNINSSNGAPPSYVRFGFAGSTGGSTNVHEIMCFKSTPAVTTGSSAGVNEKQTAKVEAGTFAYFAHYDPNNWVGSVTANGLYTDSNGLVAITSTPAWDANCPLTGVPTGKTCSTTVPGPTAAQTPASRNILTYNAGGVSFEWGSLSTAQQNALTTGDPASSQYRLNYLRGDRSNEINSAGTCTYATSSPCFRARTGLIADIVDSSPTWVGPPQLNYTATWQDKLYPATSMAENSGTQTYQQFIIAQQTRPNIVYVGSNDGMLHGFRSGSNDSAGNFTTATTPNDGQEVIAYVPGSLLLSTSTGGACASLAATGSTVQNIHGVTPAFTPTTGPVQPACVTPALDYSGPQYGHNFYVDSTPGTGDLYYSGAWHTWLASGLGAGGSAIFALDITNPTTTNYVEGNASSLVIGEWTPSSISCVSNTTCGTNLGNTFGTPLIRRMHDGRWAVIFGNGYGSANGDAGIYVMTVDSSGSKLFYYISTGNTGSSHNNGIGYVASADMDGDHISDYIYAGDLMGNLWRFDLTSATESAWAVSPGPIFTTPAGQPITSQIAAANGVTAAGGNTQVITFGTGQRTQFTNTSQPLLKTTTQSLYGVWDWNMTSWNSKSTLQFSSLSTTASGLTGPSFTLSKSQLQQQVFTLNADGSTRDINSPTAICWAGSSGCTGAGAKFGWYLDLIGTQEQIIYNPLELQGVFIVNSIIPANNLPTGCSTSNDTGITYAINSLTGAPPANFFSQVHSPSSSFHDANAAGYQLNAVGTMYFLTSGAGNTSGIYEDTSGANNATPFPLPGVGKGKRLTWVQLR